VDPFDPPENCVVKGRIIEASIVVVHWVVSPIDSMWTLHMAIVAEQSSVVVIRKGL
jgi:hypothetical protein